MQPFEGDPYTRARLTSLRNKSQQKQPGQLSASIPGWIVSQRVQLTFGGEKCVLLLCAWKPAFIIIIIIINWFYNIRNVYKNKQKADSYNEMLKGYQQVLLVPWLHT